MCHENHYQLPYRISTRCLQSGRQPFGVFITAAIYSTHLGLFLQSSCRVRAERILMVCSLLLPSQGISNPSNMSARQPRDSKSSFLLSGSPLTWLLLAKGLPLKTSTTSSGCPLMSTQRFARLKSITTSCPSSLSMKCSGSTLRQRYPQSWTNSRILRASMRMAFGGRPTMLPLLRSNMIQLASSLLKSTSLLTQGQRAIAMFFQSRSYIQMMGPSPSGAYLTTMGCEFLLEQPQKIAPCSGPQSLHSRMTEEMVLRLMLCLWWLEWLLRILVWIQSSSGIILLRGGGRLFSANLLSWSEL